jgi:hypothetical protein
LVQSPNPFEPGKEGMFSRAKVHGNLKLNYYLFKKEKEKRLIKKKKKERKKKKILKRVEKIKIKNKNTYSFMKLFKLTKTFWN